MIGAMSEMLGALATATLAPPTIRVRSNIRVTEGDSEIFEARLSRAPDGDVIGHCDGG